VRLPRLHVVTDDAILGRPDFLDTARALLVAHGDAIALHVRAPEASVRRLLAATAALVETAAERGGTVLVNDRIDVVLAAGAHGVHLREGSIPPADARPLVGDRLLGRSIHAVDGAAAVARWTDFLFLGTIYPTATHPERTPLGAAALAEIAAATDTPVLAIGGVGVERVAEVMRAGAHGAAVLRGVWDAADPVERAGEYLREMGRTP
jgi:thiamine-phosphate diphosphorylase